MHVNHQAVVCVHLEQLGLSQVLRVHEVLDVHVLVGKDHVWMSVLVSWRFQVVHFQVLLLLILVY